MVWPGVVKLSQQRSKTARGRRDMGSILRFRFELPSSNKKGVEMLAEYDVHVDIGVKNLDAARDFYEDTLGLRPERESDWEVYYRCGGSWLKVYQSEFAGTNKATYCSWEVDDVTEVVDWLKEKGVEFEHYTGMPDVVIKGDVHDMGDRQAAWFKDPDGNILCIGNKVVSE